MKQKETGPVVFGIHAPLPPRLLGFYKQGHMCWWNNKKSELILR